MHDDAQLIQGVQRKLSSAGPASNGSLFTLREIKIVRLLAQELANKQIADKLFCRDSTAEPY